MQGKCKGNGSDTILKEEKNIKTNTTTAQKDVQSGGEKKTAMKKEKKGKKEKDFSRMAFPNSFEIFWAAYPRRISIVKNVRKCPKF